MAPNGTTPRRRTTRSLLTSSPASKSPQQSSKRTASKPLEDGSADLRNGGNAELDPTLPKGDREASLDNGIATETPSQRKRNGDHSSMPTPRARNGVDPAAQPVSAARKRKAVEMLEHPGSSPMASDTIVLDSMTRSSGRARRKTSKLAELEDHSQGSKSTPKTSARKAAKGDAPIEVEEADSRAPEDPKPLVSEPADEYTEETTVDPVEVSTAPTITPRKGARQRSSMSKRKPAAAVGEPAPEEVSIVTNERMQTSTPLATTPNRKRGRPKGSTSKRSSGNAASAPPSEAVVDDQGDAVDIAATPATTPRKRGRPKGSTNKRQSVNAISDLPFEDISIDTSTKPRKLSGRAKIVAPIDDAAIDEVLLASLSGDKEPTHDDRRQSVTIAHPSIAEASDPAFDELVNILKKPANAKSFATLREEIVLRLSGRALTPLVGLESEYEQVRTLVQRTVAAGEGNSMLVIGNRGVGKTTLVETALAEVAQAHASDFHVIRLNGFLHTDDRLALKEIWRQLGHEMQLEDANAAAAARINAADTLASLLAVLSHPAELDPHAMLQPETTETAKSVIFVLDEFDRFTAHPRQTLLYNLFDIAQSRKAPIAVLGLTTRIDVVESLEKRVKSRFSHRYVHLPHPRTYSTFLATLQAALHCTPAPEFAPPPTAPSTSPLSTANPVHHALLHAWTAHVQTSIYASPLCDHLKQTYAHSKSIPSVLTALLPALLSATPSHPPNGPALAAHLAALSPPTSKLALLPSLSDAALALLAAAARLDILLHTDAVNFALAYDEYLRLTTRARIVAGPHAALGAGGAGGWQRTWSRETCRAAWEQLAGKGLLVPVLGAEGAGGVLGDGAKRDRLWRVDVSLEEIGRASASGWVGREVGGWCRNL